MAEWSIENTLTINKMEDAASRDWSISGGMTKSAKQATVVLNSGAEYQYASYYPVNEGDIAIIGNRLPGNYSNEMSSNSGQMGAVTVVEPKLTIKRSHAVELDLVFTENVTKRTITSCINYLDKPDDEDTLRELLQHGKYTEYVYPVTFLIRKIFMAASIVAHPDLASVEAVEKAKKYMHKSQRISNNINELRTFPVYEADQSVHIFDLHIYAVEGKNVKYIKAREAGKYAIMGAVAIMVRGGFVNLLKAFLSANPPISKYYDEMIGYLGNTGNKEALDVIKNYKI